MNNDITKTIENQLAQATAAATAAAQTYALASLAHAESGANDDRKRLAEAQRNRDLTEQDVRRLNAALTAAKKRELEIAHQREDAEQAQREAAVARMAKARHQNGVETDAWLRRGAELVAERRRMDKDLLALVPGAQYGHLSILGNADFLLAEQMTRAGIPGGVRTLRSETSYRSCTAVAAEVNTAALAAVKVAGARIAR